MQHPNAMFLRVTPDLVRKAVLGAVAFTVADTDSKILAGPSKRSLKKKKTLSADECSQLVSERRL